MSETSKVGDKISAMASELDSLSNVGDIPYWVADDLSRLAIHAHSLVDRIRKEEVKYARLAKRGEEASET